MSDLSPTTDDEPTPTEQECPEEQAHGGSMAPGLVDPTGRPTGDDDTPPPTEQPD
jgi:hypothetical protein